MAPIWSLDRTGLAAIHEEAGMAEVIDRLLRALAGAVALLMSLEASLLTGVIMPRDLVVLFAASTATTPTRLVVQWAAVAARLGGRGDTRPPREPWAILLRAFSPPSPDVHHADAMAGGCPETSGTAARGRLLQRLPNPSECVEWGRSEAGLVGP
jgi:hypothetical protein